MMLKFDVKSLILVVLLALGSTRPALAAPTITANPNPVIIPAGQTEGKTTLSWDAGANRADSRVWMQVDNDDETLFTATAKGTAETKVTLGKKHTFKLYSGDGTQVLASVVVTAQSPPLAKSPIKIKDALRSPSTTSAFNFLIQQVNVALGVEPSGNYADITFITKEPASASVQVSTSRPTDFPEITPTGQQPSPAFPPGAVILSSNELPGAKQAQHSLRVRGLAPDATYHFVITSTGPDGRTFRYWHDFKSPNTRRVKVVFEKIRVMSDGDHANDKDGPTNNKGNGGEVYFHFGVNNVWRGRDPQGKDRRYPRDQLWERVIDNTSIDVNIEVTIDSAPPEIALAVLGYEWDAFGSGGWYGAGPRWWPDDGSPDDPRPRSLDKDDDPSKTWRTARGTIDLTSGGTHEPGTRTFKIAVPALDPNDAHEGHSLRFHLEFAYLLFEVTGRYEISYAKPSGITLRDALKSGIKVSGKGEVKVTDGIKTSDAPKISRPPKSLDPKLGNKIKIVPR